MADDSDVLLLCPSMHGEVRCALREGHGGEHLSLSKWRNLAWADPKPPSEMDRRLAVAEALLDCFQAFHDGDCRTDHNGACQAHMGEDDGCTVADARSWLAEVRAAEPHRWQYARAAVSATDRT